MRKIPSAEFDGAGRPFRFRHGIMSLVLVSWLRPGKIQSRWARRKGRRSVGNAFGSGRRRVEGRILGDKDLDFDEKDAH